jgi:BlaI family transcriptional regulator, penicillinase repressor
MARPRSRGLTDRELQVMTVLWDRGRASVSDVVDALDGRRRPAYNTVLTILRILERKRYVAHEKEGRAFVFLPLVDRGRERRRALSNVLSRFFDNSPLLLVSDLLGHERIDAEELRRVRELVEQAPADRGPARPPAPPRKS